MEIISKYFYLEWEYWKIENGKWKMENGKVMGDGKEMSDNPIYFCRVMVLFNDSSNKARYCMGIYGYCYLSNL